MHCGDTRISKSDSITDMMLNANLDYASDDSNSAVTSIISQLNILASKQCNKSNSHDSSMSSDNNNDNSHNQTNNYGMLLSNGNSIECDDINNNDLILQNHHLNDCFYDEDEADNSHQNQVYYDDDG